MAKTPKTETDNAVVLSFTEGDEAVVLTVNDEGHYILDTKVTGLVEYESVADLVAYLQKVRNREIGQTGAVRSFAPIAIDKLA